MKVLFINNNGAGFASEIIVPEGTTVADLFQQELPNASSSNYLVRVNSKAIPASQLLKDGDSVEMRVLQEGDRMTVTPTKYEGAN